MTVFTHTPDERASPVTRAPQRDGIALPEQAFSDCRSLVIAAFVAHIGGRSGGGAFGEPLEVSWR